MPDQAGQVIGVQLQADGSFVVQGGTRALQLTTLLSCNTCQSQDEYSQAELYSLLALGTPDISTLGNNIGALGQNALSTALNVFVLGELQRNIARALGVDVFRISSNLVTPEGNFDAKFTVGTYLSKQFYLQYQVDLTGANLIDATYTTPDNRFYPSGQQCLRPEPAKRPLGLFGGLQPQHPQPPDAGCGVGQQHALFGGVRVQILK